MCVHATWPVWRQEETKNAYVYYNLHFCVHYCWINSYHFIHQVGHAWKFRMDCVELWIQTTTLSEWGHHTFCKISSICECLPCHIYQKRESKFPEMWLSTLWVMWYSLFSHSKDHQWSWSHNDKNTTLEGISCAFWVRRVKNQFSTHERNFYTADRRRYGSSHIRGEH